jgi:hypothetical protein
MYESPCAARPYLYGPDDLCRAAYQGNKTDPVTGMARSPMVLSHTKPVGEAQDDCAFPQAPTTQHPQTDMSDIALA